MPVPQEMGCLMRGMKMAKGGMVEFMSAHFEVPFRTIQGVGCKIVKSLDHFQ